MRTARRTIGGAFVVLLLAVPAASGEIVLGPEGVEPGIDKPIPVPGSKADEPTPRLSPIDEVEEEPGASAAADHAVEIADFLFDPETIEVSVGDTVTWTNEDEAPHDATADDDSFATTLLDQGESDSVTFDEEGTFSYICSIHPPDGGYEDFVGTVEVVAAGSGGDDDSGGSGGGAGSAAIPPPLDLGSGSPSTFDSGGSGSSATGSLPDTGLDAVLLLAIGAGLLAAGLLARAVVEHLSWR
jgi:plastocyanin